MKNETIIEKEGYKRLNPIPTQDELDDFYKKQYSDLIKKGGRAPEMEQLLDSEKRKNELEWLSKTLYEDISYHISRITKKKELIDIGCGTGDFLNFLKEKNYEVAGIEPSQKMAIMLKNIKVYNGTIEEYISQEKFQKYDIVTMLNVLEHVPNPKDFLEKTKKILNENGIIVIRIPNDYTEIQEEVIKNIKLHEYWIARPDHINYFNTKNFTPFVESLGFEVIYKMTDFPMEFFLLMGENYVGNSEIGKKCHKKRIEFETNISPEFRRKLYEKFAEIGIGRNMVFFIKMK